jgi:vancomycin resistance protein VanJ
MSSVFSENDQKDVELPPPSGSGFQERLLQALQTRSLAELLTRQLRRLVRFLTALYMVGLVMTWAGLSLVGESNLTTAFLLYLPPVIWFLPFPFLLIAALVLDRKSAVLLSALGSLILFLWVQFRPFGPKWQTSSRDDALTVLTYNRGQQGSQSLQPFKNSILPDVVVLQDAGGRAEGYLRSPGYVEFQDARSVGEHTLLSRYPILDAGLLQGPGPHPGPRSARFVIDWKGHQVVIYSVHLKTPRDVLRSQSRGGFLYGILGVPGTPWAERRRAGQQFWDGQLADATALIDAVADEVLPCIIAGDFNAPHLGTLYRRLTQKWIDAHSNAGRGFGFTFPGTTRNPLSAGGPWMRIDYIFVTPDWHVEACQTETDRASQHRALGARLRRVISK